jgi:hypothetical protein
MIWDTFSGIAQECRVSVTSGARVQIARIWAGLASPTNAFEVLIDGMLFALLESKQDLSNCGHCR